MKIAQVAPLFESVPPKRYGGTERVVSYLTEELVRQGHEVTLFASGDSRTAARLVPCCDRSLRLDAGCVDQLAHQITQLDEVFSRVEEFDILHFHIDYLHYPLSRSHRHITAVTTLHGRLDLPDLVPLYRRFHDQPVISISNAQRAPLPHLNWQATVHHGLPPDLHTLREKPGTYLAFLGRVSPEKRVDRAIEIARRVGMPLKIAAKVDINDREYYEAKIAPLLKSTGSLVEFIGEIGGKAKDEFLGNAYALLFPIEWPEPFGLVMIEAMACGTPVIAYPRGSVREVVEHGTTGFIVPNLRQAVAAVRRVETLSRRRCREVFERRFTVERMARDYAAVYSTLLLRTRRDGDAESRQTAAQRFGYITGQTALLAEESEIEP